MQYIGILAIMLAAIMASINFNFVYLIDSYATQSRSSTLDIVIINNVNLFSI
jgi:hypothetical protein